jgi:hypothetical protein
MGREADQPDDKLEKAAPGSLDGKIELSLDVGHSEEPDSGPEDGLEDKKARFSFKRDERQFEVLCYDVMGGDSER